MCTCVYMHYSILLKSRGDEFNNLCAIEDGMGVSVCTTSLCFKLGASTTCARYRMEARWCVRVLIAVVSCVCVHTLSIGLACLLASLLQVQNERNVLASTAWRMEQVVCVCECMCASVFA